MTLTADFNPNVAVPFSRMRYLLQESGGLQPGVVAASDLMVVQRGAGANMSVDVGIGGAWVGVTTGTRNGLVHCFNDAVANVTITAAHATLPRIDQIYLRYNDSSIPTGSGDVPTLAVATGTATAGATLANRTGAAALPADTLRLADVLVAAVDTSITNSEIRDRRQWARGACMALIGTAAGSYTTNSSGYIDIDGTNLSKRLECSGVPMMLQAQATGVPSAGIGSLSIAVDGTAIPGLEASFPTTSFGVTATIAIPYTPSIGSHNFQLVYKTTAGTLTVFNSATLKPFMLITEIIRQNTANNTTTSG